jgi:hypothetical protein
LIDVSNVNTNPGRSKFAATVSTSYVVLDLKS